MNYKIKPNRIYAEDGSGKLLAEILFPKTDESTYVITRTFVDDTLRGQGVAGKLMQKAVEQIENQGGTVTATCSYAQKWLEKQKNRPKA